MHQMCGVHKQVRLAHLEPVLTQFNRFHHMYAQRCTLRTCLRDVLFNLANKQQASNSKQTLLNSILAIPPPHRSELYSTLAILEPRWCPCQIQVLSQKLTDGAPGRGRQVGRCPPKTAHFGPQNNLFWPKTARILSQNGQTKQTVPTLHVALDCRVTKSPFLPPSSTICPRNGPKMAKTGLNVRCLCQKGPKPRRRRILAYVAQNRIPRAPSPLATPHFFLVCNPQNRPTRHLDPLASGHLVEPEGNRARARLGPTVGPRWPAGRKKQFFQSCS